MHIRTTLPPALAPVGCIECVGLYFPFQPIAQSLQHHRGWYGSGVCDGTGMWGHPLRETVIATWHTKPAFPLNATSLALHCAQVSDPSSEHAGPAEQVEVSPTAMVNRLIADQDSVAAANMCLDLATTAARSNAVSTTALPVSISTEFPFPRNERGQIPMSR